MTYLQILMPYLLGDRDVINYGYARQNPGGYGFGFGAMAKRFKGRIKHRWSLNIPGVRMANGKRIPKGNR